MLFTANIDIINARWPLTPPVASEKALAAYVKPEVLCIDDLGYLPIDKFGADCLFRSSATATAGAAPRC
ncbi:MAG: hypothetical protein IPQ21_21895 [Betaproteobacteria bacterium]|nr:hypothetical protein [Betaproteobacteria bacterium]